MKLLYGTTNRAKLDAMKKALAGLPIEMIGLGDLSGPLPKIEEDGATPLENAQRKARAYYEAFGIPVFSCDSGLYFDEVQPQEQEEGAHDFVIPILGKEKQDENNTKTSTEQVANELLPDQLQKAAPTEQQTVQPQKTEREDGE